jgi:hypothetical protein
MMRRLATAGLTFALAAGSGYVLQHGLLDTMREPASAESIPPDSIVTLTGDAPDAASLPPAAALRSPADPALPDLPAMAFGLPDPGLALGTRMASVERGYDRPPGAADATYDDFGFLCPAASFRVTPGRDGMLAVSFADRCAADMAVVLAHAGLGFAGRTDAEGRLSMMLPVLDAGGMVTLSTDMGRSLSAGQPAHPGKTAHIAVSSDLAGVLSLASGRPTAIGGDQMPSAWMQALAVTEAAQPVMLRAAVTPDSCGRDLTARIGAAGGGLSPQTTTVTLAMPDCDSVGESVALALPLTMLPAGLADADQR